VGGEIIAVRTTACAPVHSRPMQNIKLAAGQSAGWQAFHNRRSPAKAAEVYKAVARYSAIIANVHSEPPVGTAPPMARRARPPPKPEATVTYCRPLCV
jgi:hypothetical protein